MSWPGTLRGSDSDGKFAPSEVEANVRSYKDSWKDAQAAAAALADGKCGLTDGSKVGDWRLPTVSELKGLINKNFKNPAISNRKGDAKWLPGDAFIGVKSKIYWSATKDKGGGFTTVSFKSGTVFTKLPGAYVWPVRGGK